jgi:hypothetical protein
MIARCRENRLFFDDSPLGLGRKPAWRGQRYVDSMSKERYENAHVPSDEPLKRFESPATADYSARIGVLRALSLALLDLDLPAADGAPILVLGHGHSAFHADTHALQWRRSIR